MFILRFLYDVRAASHLFGSGTSSSGDDFTVCAIAVAATEGCPTSYGLTAAVDGDGIICRVDVGWTIETILTFW